MASMEIALQARHSMGLSQREFAQLLGCLRQSVSRWECGKRNPSSITLALFALLIDDPQRSKRVLGNLLRNRLQKEMARLIGEEA